MKPLQVILIIMFSITTVALYSSLHNIDLYHNADLLNTSKDCNVFGCYDLDKLYENGLMYAWAYPILIILLIIIYIQTLTPKEE